ncbi:MAG: hypothetical protein B9S32_05795 [Verrucomicrobia bacterium Tous-C9LFEB]|nr:MAG: hypothetical protein B9S32_05795 [Verrucomicrobia bacterium Tous-C9LFEB]
MKTRTGGLCPCLGAIALSLGLWLGWLASASALPEVIDNGWSPLNLQQVLLVPGQPVELMLRATPPQAGATVSYQLLDYCGKTIRSEKVVADAEGLAKIPLTLPAGYYTLSIAGQERTIGLISQPENTTRDSFFSIDAAMSWLTPVEKRAELISNLKALGISMVRERLSWGQINSDLEKWDWETPRKYESTRQLYREAGLPVLEMFHDAPRWVLGNVAGTGKPSVDRKYPEDLQATSNSWQRIARQWQKYWGAVEAWNEPDILFGGNLPADQYLPLLKTVRYALGESKVATPLGGGVFAYYSPPFFDLAARNGLLTECDFVSFHYYQDALGIEDRAKKMRDWLAQYGQETKPLWITEIGCPIAGKPAQFPTLIEQQKSALEFAMKTVEARACGIANYFAFVYVFYPETGKNFGMIDGKGAPLRSLSAYATTIRLLAGASYLGDVKGMETSVQRARVFDLVNSEALVVLATGKLRSNAVKVSFPVLAIYGVDGRKLELLSDGRVPMDDGMAYIRVKKEALAGVLDKDTQANRLYALSQKKTPPLKPASPIILQPLIDRDSVQATSCGYLLSETTKLYPLRLKVNNLSGQDREVLVTVANAQKIPVKVGARSGMVVEREIDVATLPMDQFGSNILTVTATSTGDAPISPVAISLSLPRGLEVHLKNAEYQFALPIAELNRWEKNAAGRMDWLQTTEMPFGYKISIGAPDKWAFPKFTLPQEVDRLKVEAVAVRVRCEKEAIVRLATWDEAGRFQCTGYSIIRPDGKWHVAYIPLQSFLSCVPGRPMLGPQISVGINSKEIENKVEISDFYLLGGSRKSAASQ